MSEAQRAKRLLLSPALIAAALLSSCSYTVQFDLRSQGDSTVQGGAPLNVPGFGNLNQMSYSQDQTFQDQHTNKDRIQSATLSRVTLEVTSPANGDLSFLSAVDFYVSAPNLPKVHVAKLASAPPVGTRSVDLVLDAQELAPYAKADSFSLTSSVTGSAPPQTETLRVTLVTHVVAQLL